MPAMLWEEEEEGGRPSLWEEEEGRWPASPLPSLYRVEQHNEGRGDAGHRPSSLMTEDL
jgi:hypothetical protein